MFFVVQVNSDDYDWRQINDSVTIVNFNQVLAISSHLVERNANKFWNNVKDLKGSCSFINYYKDDYSYPKELLDFINERRRIYTVKIQEEPHALSNVKVIDGNVVISNRIFGFKVGYPIFFTNTSSTIETISDLFDTMNRTNIEVGLPTISTTFFYENNLWNNRHFVGGEFIYSPESRRSDIDLDAYSYGLKAYYKYSQEIY
jgi:hypothetical protein